MSPMIGRILCGLTLVSALGCVQKSSTGSRVPRSTVEDETAAYAKTITDAEELLTWSSQLAELELFQLREDKVVTSTSVNFLSLSRGTKAPFLVQFFATYCPPCIKEIPSFNDVYVRGTKVFGVSLDVSNHEGLLQLIAEHPPKYPVYVLTPDSLEQFTEKLDGLPMTMVFEAESSLREVVIGQITTAQLDALVSKYLKSNKNPSQK